MFVKICGTTNLPDAELAVELGADAVGFVFAAESKRRVVIEQVAAIAAHLPDTVERVGVFTEPDVAEIARAVHEAGLTAVQMHFRHDAEFVSAFRRAVGQEIKLWQVIGVPACAEAFAAARDNVRAELVEALLDARISVVLLDSVKDGATGGLGVSLPWTAAGELVREAQAVALQAPGRGDGELPKVALAGGLNAANVKAAIAELRPWGVDAVSGVEISPGRKGPDRLRAFVAAARAELAAVRERGRE